MSPSDPAATGAHGGQANFAYSTNYLIDVENAIIVDVEATTAIRQAEVLAAKRMIQRSLERFDLYPSRLLGDSAYGSAEMLGWLLYEHGIEPHVTVFSSAFSGSTAYVYEAQMVRVTSSSSQPPPITFERWLNCSRCPAQGLHRRGQAARPHRRLRLYIELLPVFFNRIGPSGTSYDVRFQAAVEGIADFVQKGPGAGLKN